jgi:uncharacterized Fe-S cluster-containing protein
VKPEYVVTVVGTRHRGAVPFIRKMDAQIFGERLKIEHPDLNVFIAPIVDGHTQDWAQYNKG